MAKRILLTLVLLVLLSAGAVPWLAGQRAQEFYEQAVLDLERRGLRVLESRYRRGWLVSEAETDLALAVGGSARDGDDWRLRASSRVEHGPLAWGDLLQGRIRSMAGHAMTHLTLTKGSGEPYPLGPMLRTRVDLEGGANVRLLPGDGVPFQRDGIELRTGDMQGEIRIDGQRDRIQADIRVPLLMLSEDGESRVRIRNLAMTADTANGVSGLRLGRGTLVMDEAYFVNPDPAATLLLRGLDVEVESGAEGESVWAAVTYRVEELRTDDGRLAATEIKVRADRLSAPVLARLERSLSDLVRSDPARHYQALALMATLGANLNELLQDNPQVTVERLHLATEDGVLDGRLKLSVSGWQAAYILNPDRWLEVLDGAAELSVSEALLRRLVADSIQARLERDPQFKAPSTEQAEQRSAAEAQSRIDQWLRQELAVRDAESIVTRARISAGLLTVNGKTVPLPSIP